MITRGDIIRAVADFAPPTLQESWDNSGVQVDLDPARECTGVLLGVDVTPEVVAEAAARGCNLIVSPHPLLFRGVKTLTGATGVERALIEAVRADIAVYSAHTSLDSAPGGVSWEMARMLGAEVTGVLAPSATDPDAGLGVVTRLARPCGRDEFIRMVALTFGAPRSALLRGRLWRGDHRRTLRRRRG